MKNKRFVCLAGGLLLFLLAALACSTPALRFFSTPTPTPSLTPTLTYTPTFTSTFTPTPLPPVQIVACPFEGNISDICLEAKTPEELLPDTEDLQANIEYPIEFSYTEQIYLGSGWCASTKEILDGNLASIQFVFTIDGYSYLSSLAQGYYTVALPTGEAHCYGIAGVLQAWKEFENHIVKIGLQITEPIFDGWDKYEPHQYIYTYYFKPIRPTPTATFTLTRTPTRTRAPVYYTATPPCTETAPLYIQNDTGGYISLNLSGVTRFSFWLAPGYHTLQICPGMYSFTASGCGGASTSGTMSAGEEHRFYCTSGP
ncbi:MAG: hypothetical protein N2049_01975 [Anaerolineales bacterium]|nr:hypothetical protein [Anaerolineales bacterium]MCX7607974.1 hypothetical protein [Anaerolineales bacterium]MDW8227620.1 hypothetical protein [Anaerolineales bacterium]